MALLEGLGGSCVPFLSSADLRFQQALGVALPCRMWYGTAALLFFKLRLLWFIVVFVVGCLLGDLFPDRCCHSAPVLDLVGVELVDGQVWLRIHFLPLDGVEVRTKLRKSIQLDCGHLLLSVDDVISHLVNVVGLLLVVLQVDHSGPS